MDVRCVGWICMEEDNVSLNLLVSKRREFIAALVIIFCPEKKKIPILHVRT